MRTCAVRLCHLASILALLAGNAGALASEECVTTKVQPNVRRHIEKLARAEMGGGAVDRSTFSYCGYGRLEAASVSGTWQPQADGSRLRHLVLCQREYATPTKPWACTREPEREMDVVVPGRAGGSLVAQVDVDLTVDLAANMIRRAFEAAPEIQSTQPCNDFQADVQRPEEVTRAFADPGPSQIYANKHEDRLLIGRGYTMIVFKRDPQFQDRYELYCWYTYVES